MPLLHELRQFQAMPLELKILMTERRIQIWHEKWDGNIHIAFSGGKDSTVLVNIARKLYQDIPVVFSDTGLEFPEIKSFVRSFSNLTIVRPKISFREVLSTYGYPIISKNVARSLRDLQNSNPNNQAVCNLRLTGFTRKGTYCPSYKLPKKYLYLVNAPFKISEQCCHFVKKTPLLKYERDMQSKPMIATLASESQTRERFYLMHGCLAFHYKYPAATPLSFWTEQDILQYLKQYNVPYCEVYGDIVEKDGMLITTQEQRTGCIYCGFGAHLEKEPNRFQRLAISHPKLYHYCMNDLGLDEVLSYIKVPH